MPASAPSASSAPKKKSVWRLNLPSLFSLLFALSLSSTDPLTLSIVSVSLAVSLGTAWFSIRTRPNLFGFLLLAAAGYVNITFLIFVLRHR